MNARLLFVLTVLVVPACSETPPELAPSPAVCHAVVAARDSALLGLAAMWSLDSTPLLTVEQQQRLALIRSRPTSADVHVARLSPSADSLLQLGNAVILTVAPGRSVVAVGENATRRGPNDVSWSGPIEGVFGWATLVLTGVGVTGSLHSGTAAYHFEPIGGSLQALTCIDGSKYGPD
jgi:hypothetical protein